MLTIHQGLFGFFEFSFEPVIDASDSDKKRFPFDEKVRNTIAYALIRFFEDTENILYYVCDSSDGRQLSRERLFKKWFADMQPFHVSQLEVSLSDDLKILILIHDAFPFVEQFKEELSGSEMFYSAQK